MSLRTTPLWVRTFGPFVPSPGNGPAVSSGIGAQLASVAAAAVVVVVAGALVVVVVDALADVLFVALLAPPPAAPGDEERRARRRRSAPGPHGASSARSRLRSRLRSSTRRSRFRRQPRPRPERASARQRKNSERDGRGLVAGPVRLALLDEHAARPPSRRRCRTPTCSARACRSQSSSGVDVERVVHQLLRGLHPEGAVLCDAVRERDRLVEHTRRRHDAIDEPNARARAASMRSPVSPISSAMAIGMTRPRRIPPPPANSPRLTSGSPNSAWSEATTRSHPSRSSRPPPDGGRVRGADDRLRAPAPQEPHVRGHWRRDRPTRGVPSLKSRRSIPAQNARSPVPVITIARTAGSASAASMPPPMPASTAPLSALRASGRLMRSTAHRAAILDDDFVR